ncbi:CLAVATA3/ESR (CLE)-related protein 10-like [Mangifera indica]|uniref:CLAVATA3/ESR (CLE)-related protein 10-like n=1 Tax=Mangifera indica TaxID=29780 RepID=UPI001CFBC075|nr:CLAVATA3/ESR (CLE)-related protein 10-like [Mangifera indica]
MQRHRFLILILLLLLLLVFSTSATRLPKPSSTRNYHPGYSCDSFSNKKSRLLCIQLQRIHRHSRRPPPPPPPPLSPDAELDPVFGVDKRLVPSGPNPLHN